MASRKEAHEVFRDELIKFCKEFIKDPYLCYTEHGLHALFFARLYNRMSESKKDSQYTEFNNHRLCVIQKEYPTYDDLGESRRQHWDISLIKTPIVPPDRSPAYDYFSLTAVAEFGLNCPDGHLARDIRRLCHACANVEYRFPVHLYRLSDATGKVSGRDLTHASERRCTKESALKILLENCKGLRDREKIEVIYGVADVTGEPSSKLWSIKIDKVEQIA